jgi:hypothetical protein
MTQMIEHLLSKHKALSSNTSCAKKERNTNKLNYMRLKHICGFNKFYKTHARQGFP